MPSRFKGINEYIDCACGKCGQKLWKYDPTGRVRKFIVGHYAKMEGNKFSIYNVKKEIPNELIDCKCNCGEKLWKFDKDGREHRFKRGHHAKGKGNPMYGKKNPRFAEMCRKQVGEKNPNYGNLKPNPERRGLHRYVESKFPKTELCMLCKLVPPHHLANITGIYERDNKNWAWFCRSCHMKYDNIVRNFKGKRRGKAKVLFFPNPTLSSGPTK